MQPVGIFKVYYTITDIICCFSEVYEWVAGINLVIPLFTWYPQLLRDLFICL